MTSRTNSTLRVLNFVWLVIVLGLVGNLIDTQNHVNPQVNFCIFAAVFGLLFGVFYGVLAQFFSALAFPILLTSFDFLNVVFTFAGATSLAVAIRTHSCSNMDYVNSNAVTQGSSMRCREAQAATAFLYFSFFTFLASLILSAVAITRNGLSLPSRRSAPRGGVPTMSQV
ncbi:hypothetical protein CANCADRAFT_56918 [Tortispora caseinolytica NRRL Y-17796]|uniref:MARVEL domain-containing protein n=1 Tax=Tortispora caseinolytica NRRL Y-17796 TaxID=767744 RepID=A0A1E4TF27_9ASCO|nr:hypothetical protein CANCADRAFT_56918 [Tortispora caseinolytica NRRL Y-17796]